MVVGASRTFQGGIAWLRECGVQVVELVVGLISRTAPSLSFMVIGYPLRLIVGLVLLAALVPTIPAVTNSLLDTVVMAGAGMARAFR